MAWWHKWTRFSHTTALTLQLATPDTQLQDYATVFYWIKSNHIENISNNVLYEIQPYIVQNETYVTKCDWLTDELL